MHCRAWTPQTSLLSADVMLLLYSLAAVRLDSKPGALPVGLDPSTAYAMMHCYVSKVAQRGQMARGIQLKANCI